MPLLRPLLFLLLLGACLRTEDAYRDRVNQYIGASEDQLIADWGVPTRSFETARQKFLLFDVKRRTYIPGTPPNYWHSHGAGLPGHWHRVGGIPPRYVTKQCETTFTIVRGRVTEVRFKGNDCLAVAPDQGS